MVPIYSAATSSTTVQFVDTNVLIYAVIPDPVEKRKGEVAREIVDRPDLAFSVQVFQEFYYQVTRPTRPEPLSPARAVGFLDTFVSSPIQELTLSLVQSAFQSSQRWQISYWDAAILEAARSLGCDVVLTEDLSHGQDYGGVRVENPFLALS
jgi:predicted nucleic acid-binding protein